MSVDTHHRFSPVFITGATGFVGVHATHAFLEAGYQVKVLVRPTSDLSRLPNQVEKVIGSLEHPSSLRDGLKGCRSVVHIAGLVRVKRGEDFYQINREGTHNLVQIAQEVGIERLIYISSQAAGGPSTPYRPRMTDDPDSPVTDYGRSKLEGEMVLRQGNWRFWWAIIRPPVVYGPWDRAFLPFIRWVKRGFKVRLSSGKMPFSIIFAPDLAQAIRMALEVNSPTGNIWFVTDGNEYTLVDLGEAVEKALNRKAHWLTIPGWVAPFLSWTIKRAEAIKLFRFARNEVWRKAIELSQPAWTCDDKPFRQVSGFEPQYDLFSGMAETVKWYMKMGWI
ncbi:MAG: NAD-dependent epimerase/dehydratase family protein [bacterium]